MTTQVEPVTIELPNDTTAPRIARHVVAEHVGDHPRRDDLLLCVSEVVTNAVLHARSAGELRIRHHGDHLVIEVSDRDPNLPARRQHDLQAPTGRGLRLLDALTVEWGTSPTEDGKIVWFEFDLGGERSMGATTSDVHLVGMPLDVHRRASEHGETLRRELTLVHHTIAEDAVPARLRALGEELAPHYQGLNSASDDLLAQALAAGRPTLDLTYKLPARAADDLERVDRLLDELDQYCIDRDLLTLVTPPEARAYRRWWIRELIEQLQTGRAPIPWSDLPSVDEGAAAAPLARPSGTGSKATIAIHGDLDLERAPGLRDEIVAATEAGATILVVDLADCPFMDSTGISLLLTTQMRLDAEGGSLVLTNLSPQVASVLELSGLTELMT
jgi:anti-anti-sigma factor